MLCQDYNLKALDLGLSVKWADRNIGARTPSDIGHYYAWGEIKTKRDYSDETYQFIDDGAYIDIGQDIAATEYDVAAMQLGKGWRMPTMYEVAELFSLCLKDIEERDGIIGVKFVGPNGRSIFIPAGGCKVGKEKGDVGEFGFYWTSTRTFGRFYSAACMCFDQEECNIMDAYRRMGCPIRPVHD